jgi:DNA-binding CsgD family transcriptional regulator
LLPFDAFCVNTADPATLLITGSVGDGLPAERASRLFEIEYGEPDYSKLSELATRDRNVAVLGEETGSCPEKSTRMREVFLPMGYQHELRCALLLGNCCWGYLHLFRSTGGRDFSREEAEMVEELGVDIALGLRLSVLRGAPTDDSPLAPGLILLSADGHDVESMNDPARRWIAELEGQLRDPLPHSICAVAQRARTLRDDGEPAARSRLQTRTGSWLAVHGTKLGGRVAVVLERAQPHEVAPIILLAYGLSQREENVVQLLLHGLSNEEIAADLKLSTHTVKDHIKSIFRKVGAASRAEVAARIFSGQYAPRIAKRAALAGNGWFAYDKTGS